MTLTYLEVLSVLVVVVCLASIAVMTRWTVPDAFMAWRETTGAERVYSWWVLFRTLICYVSLILFGFVGLSLLTLGEESVLRIQFSRHAVVAIVVGLAAIGLSGPVEKRSVQRALAQEAREGRRSSGLAD